MEITEKFIVVNKLGLHLRAAAELVKTAHKFKCKIKVRKQGLAADARSLMNLIALGAAYGSELAVTFEGEDAWPASRAFADLFKTGFREMETAVA
ncbi:MAG TPA: HPr family phosphocarrier protein [bacterium]|nr:HPr family phosphocarrier protein [bacterium]